MTANALLWFGDAQGSCTDCNGRWLEWTGGQKQQMMGHSWLEFVHPEDRDRSAKLFAQHSAQRAPLELDIRLRRADGEYRTMLAIAVPRVDHSGGFVGLTCSMIDISDYLASRRTRPDAQALLQASSEAAHAAGMVGTAEGASVRRVATYIADDRKPVAAPPPSGARRVHPLVDADDIGAQAHPGRAIQAPGRAVVVGCAIDVDRQLPGDWTRAEIHRVLAEHLVAYLRADDAVIDCDHDHLAVVLPGVTDEAGALAARHVLEAVLTRPIEIAGTRIEPRARLAHVQQAPGEPLTHAIGRACRKLEGSRTHVSDPAGHRPSHAAGHGAIHAA